MPNASDGKGPPTVPAVHDQPDPAPQVNLAGTTRDTRVESAAAIRADTFRWRDTRTSLQNAWIAVEGAKLDVDDLSFFGVGSQAITAYDAQREKIMALLAEGMEVMGDVEDRLVHVSRAIELNEEENRESLAIFAEILEEEKT